MSYDYTIKPHQIEGRSFLSIITRRCNYEYFVNKYKQITLLHFDAHADLRESYQGEKFSHASAIKRCLDFENVNVVSFGIRNLSKSEMDFFKNNRDNN